MSEINRKSKLRQLFCGHKKSEWFRKKESSFSCISGETHYKVCTDCGKTLDTRFREYEGMGFK